MIALRRLRGSGAAAKLDGSRYGNARENRESSAEGGTEFALVPGGECRLGFDASNWIAARDELESWADTAEEYELASNVVEYVDSVTTPPRAVALDPLLVETKAAEVGWEPIGIEDPDAKELIAKLPVGTDPYQSTLTRGDREIRVTRDERGRVIAEVAVTSTHAELCTILSDRGFRYPTSDEWEFICGAGGSTLFRWGDHVPCDRYPTDISPKEAAWRREWVLSRGKLKRPAGGFESDWNYHRIPNAFGLHIAENPYKCELVADANMTRGGDCGCTICGGRGLLHRLVNPCHVVF